MPNRISGVLTGVAMIAIIAAGAWMFVSIATKPQSGPITAQVVLENDCGISDNVFLLMIPSTGQKLAFVNRKLTVTVNEGEPLILVTSSRFPNVTYDGSAESAAENVQMTVQCDSADYESLLNRPLKDRFGN